MLEDKNGGFLYLSFLEIRHIPRSYMGYQNNQFATICRSTSPKGQNGGSLDSTKTIGKENIPFNNDKIFKFKPHLKSK